MDISAIKSVLSDFGTFWTELYKVFTKVPGVFQTFGNWGENDFYWDNTTAILSSNGSSNDSSSN